MRLSELKTKHHVVEDIKEDEFCWGILETDIIDDESSGRELMKRVRIIYTRREQPDSKGGILPDDGKYTVSIRNLGLSSFQITPPIRVHALGNYLDGDPDTVGSAMEELLEYRRSYRFKLPEGMDPAHTEFKQAAGDSAEKKRKSLLSQTTSGPGVTVQRNN
jgi:hypothetical protein